MDNKVKTTSCSFLMLYCLWCDIFNIILGVGIIFDGTSRTSTDSKYNGLILTSGSGFIMIHSASIIYLMFHKKLRIKYHLPATRFLLIVGDIFLLTFTLLTTTLKFLTFWHPYSWCTSGKYLCWYILVIDLCSLGSSVQMYKKTENIFILNWTEYYIILYIKSCN